MIHTSMILHTKDFEMFQEINCFLASGNIDVGTFPIPCNIYVAKSAKNLTTLNLQDPTFWTVVWRRVFPPSLPVTLPVWMVMLCDGYISI